MRYTHGVEQPRHLRLLAAFALLAVVLRIPAIIFPVFSEAQASEAAVAAAITQGAELYRDLPAADPPLGYLWTAAQYGVFGELRQRAVHGVTLVAVLATILVLAMAARALGGDRGRTLAALFFAVFSSTLPPTALGACSELYAVLFGSTAVWLVLGAAPLRRYGLLGTAGAFAAIGALFRHEALAALVASLGYLVVWRPMVLGRARLGPGLRGALALLVGFAATYSLALLYLHSRGTLSDYVSAIWSDAGVGARVALTHLALFGAGTALLWFLAATELARTRRGWRVEVPQGAAPSASAPAGLALDVPELDLLAGRALRGEDDAAVAFAATWLVAAAIVLCARARFAGGDFLGLVPPLVLLGARGAASIADDFWSGPRARVFRLGIAVPAAAFVGAALFHDPFYRGVGATVISPRPIAVAVREASSPSDTVLILGPARRVYVYAPRLPHPSFEILGRQAEGDGSALPEGLVTSPPALVVDAGGPRSVALGRWLEGAYVQASTVLGARILRRRPK